MPLRLPNGRTLSTERPLIMGVLNLTPDSFSDGGQFPDQDAAVEYAIQMITDGADIIDLGGESTRPGAQRIPADEQIRRVVDITARLYEHINHHSLPTAISIDTTRTKVAAAAADAGADILNDISAGRDDPEMFSLAAQLKTPLILTHMLGQPSTMQDSPNYQDVTHDVRRFLLGRADVAGQAGVPADQIVIDPGIGFGKTADHNLTLLANLSEFVNTGYSVLLGASRKRFIAEITGHASDRNIKPAQRLGGTCATTALAVVAGVKIIRVHDVHANRQAADITQAIIQV